MEVRLAIESDLNALKEIWAMCFGDPEAYIDFYFMTRDWTSETAVLLANGKPVSMLAMIPVQITAPGGTAQKASMIFAVATHPAYQKRGYADRLMDFANQHLAQNQTMMSLLVPANEDLFRFYGKRGYRNFFFVREVNLKHSELTGLEGRFAAAGIPTEAGSEPRRIEVMISPSDPAAYNRIRRSRLAGSAWLDYRDEEILFEKRTAMMFGTDIYSVRFTRPQEQTGGSSPDCGEDASEGCFYAERASEELVVVKELLVPEECIPTALKCISDLLPAKEYVVRMPANDGAALGGSIRAFGMLRINQEDGSPVSFDPAFDDCRAYLGIAYD